jgi:hypothetical protein
VDVAAFLFELGDALRGLGLRELLDAQVKRRRNTEPSLIRQERADDRVFFQYLPDMEDEMRRMNGNVLRRHSQILGDRGSGRALRHFAAQDHLAQHVDLASTRSSDAVGQRGLRIEPACLKLDSLEHLSTRQV